MNKYRNTMTLDNNTTQRYRLHLKMKKMNQAINTSLNDDLLNSFVNVLETCANSHESCGNCRRREDCIGLWDMVA